MARDDDRRLRQYLLAKFWDAALGFWRRGAGPAAWLLTGGIVAVTLVNVFVQYRINVWYRTIALDPRSQEQLMQLVLERLPDATIVSVGHRPELEKFHTRKLVLEYRPEGARLARDEPIQQWAFRRPARLLSRLFGRERTAVPT